MMTQETEKVRKQMQIVCIDDLVPQDHLLRIIDKAIDWSFIYDLVRDTYSDGMGRPSIDPVTLIKIPLIQYLYGIKSMRQTIKEIEVNMAYRWFLGLELYDPVPHFSTFGKNYTRRFKNTDLFEQIFQHILEECYRFKLVDPTEIFVDATHVKARANNKKMQRRIAQQEALFYADMLRKDINADREAHGKKPLKDKDNHNKPGSGGNDKFEDYTDDIPLDGKTIKCSTTDPESGWFRKGEHKHVFAYGIETACDKNGWIIDFTVNPGNEHDSRTFKGLYDKLADAGMKYCIVDAGYKTPAIAKLLIDDGVKPVFPYKRPMTKDGFFRKSEYVYDEYNDAYICPGNHFLLFKFIPCNNIPISHESKNLLIALDFHKQSGRCYVTTTYKYAIRRQFLEYMRLTCSFWTQFHEIEVVLNMREQTSQSYELLTSVHCLWIQTHCVHQKVYPFIGCEVLSLVDIVLQVDV